MTMEKAQLFFEDFLHKTADEFFALPQSGSSRKNYVGRSSDKKYIITFNENLAENESFFYFSNIFSELNLNTPQIFKISDDRTLYAVSYTHLDVYKRQHSQHAHSTTWKWASH